MLKNIPYHGLVVRIILTLIFYLFLKKMENLPLINKYLYLILFVFLIFLDVMDFFYVIDFESIINPVKLMKNIKDNIADNKYYQIYDKIIDVLSYSLLLIFDIDNTLKFLILYRLIGVLIYLFTLNGKSLIIFFDFVKEYLLYVSVLGNNYNYLILFLLPKILLEYYFYYSRKLNN